MKRSSVMKLYRKELVNVIALVDLYTTGRKNKFDNGSYIDYIFRILFYGEHWNTFFCDKCDRSTIRKKFYKWRDMGVFTIAYNELLQKYNKKRIIKILHIDSTVIKNDNCKDDITDFYYKIKTKQQIKLSAICDNNNVIHATEFSNPIKHDSTFIKPLIAKLEVNLNKNSVLVGDKGYITKKHMYMKNKKNIRLVVPKRKNQKKYQTETDKKLQKQRYKIEQTFSILKRTYRRLNTVEDRLLVNYETFLIMALSCQFLKHV